MSIIDDPSLDHLIPAEEWERIERERDWWTAKVIEARARREESAQKGEETLPDGPNLPYETWHLRWDQIAEQLEVLRDTKPGEWLRVRRNAKSSAMAHHVSRGNVVALSHLDVEVFTRAAKPRTDGNPEGFEIYLRIRG